MDGHFTENGLKTIREAKLYGIDEFLDPYMGNFMFTLEESCRFDFQIKMWLQNHEDYAFISQRVEEDNYFWLTPINTLM